MWLRLLPTTLASGNGFHGNMFDIETFTAITITSFDGHFDAGTNAAARHAAARTKAGGLLSVAGGGDTVAALNHAGVADDFSYVSTAGGAFLEWLEGKPLPGVDALRAT